MIDKLRCGAQRKFIVLKEEDIHKYAFAHEQEQLKNITNNIKDKKFCVTGIDPNHEYLVINTDEPYANEVIEILKRYGHFGESDV